MHLARVLLQSNAESIKTESNECGSIKWSVTICSCCFSIHSLIGSVLLLLLSNVLYPSMGIGRPAGCSVSCSGSPAGHHLLRGTVSATRATGIRSHRSGSAAAGSAGSQTARLHPQANQPNQQRWIVCSLTNQFNL